MIVKTAVDAYVKEAEPKQNYGKAAKLWVNGGSGSDTRYAYIFFSRPFEPGVTVLSAVLHLYLAEAWGSTQTLTAKRIDEPWKESRIKWNDRPGVDSSNAGSVNVASLSAGDEIEIDLASMLDDVSGGAPWYGVRLELSTDSNRALVSSDHPNAGRHPSLEVVWSEAPQPPTSLVPGGGLAIAKTKPLLSWVFSDRSGIAAQSAAQVQISTTTDFSSPSYDSGKIANTLPRYDLAAPPPGGPVFTPLGLGVTRYWRVKVWDATDLESEWSETQEFSREGMGTLEITNPDEAPDNFVEETTPPLAWSLTGRTQTAWQATLYRAEVEGGLTQLASQPRVAGDEVEWTVPAGILRSGDVYVFSVAVWDEIDRANVAGDVGYLLESRSFTYVRSGVPDPVTDLTATADGAKVVLDFERSTDPDYFALRVDGQEVLDRIEVEDVFVSGDAYRFEYWGGVPRVTHEYEMEAVVQDGGVLAHSNHNETDTARTTPLGIWLADAYDALGVFVAGKEKASMTLGEIGTTFDPLGGPSPVRITETEQGYRGSFVGVLLDADARNDFVELRRRRTVLRLIIGDMNIPVRVFNYSAIPSPIGDQAGYDVSFEFFQDGEEELIGVPAEVVDTVPDTDHLWAADDLYLSDDLYLVS